MMMGAWDKAKTLKRIVCCNKSILFNNDNLLNVMQGSGKQLRIFFFQNKVYRKVHCPENETFSKTLFVI